MSNHRYTFPALLATAGLIFLPLTLNSPAQAETPAERCQRETQAYNDAWKRQWTQTHPIEVAEGKTAPPPPVPYRCVPVPEVTATPQPGAGAPGTGGVGSPGGSNTPGSNTDPITGLPKQVPPLNQPSSPGSGGYKAGQPPHNRPGQPGYNPNNPWIDKRHEGSLPTPTTSGKATSPSNTSKHGVNDPGLGDWAPSDSADHPLNKTNTNNESQKKSASKKSAWQRFIDRLTPTTSSRPNNPTTTTNHNNNSTPSKDGTENLEESHQNQTNNTSKNPIDDALHLIIMATGLLSGYKRKSLVFSSTRSKTDPPLSPNRQKAVAYAEKWAEGRNPQFPTRLRTQGADCTNFASQVLLAGGFREEVPPIGGDVGSIRYWSHYTLRKIPSATYGPPMEVAERKFPTRSWNNADALYHRLVDTNRAKVVGKVKGKEALKNDLAPSEHGLQPGDLIFYMNDEGKCHHVAVYVGTENGKDVVNQHSAKDENHLLHDDWQPDFFEDLKGQDRLDAMEKGSVVFVHVYYPGEKRS